MSDAPGLKEFYSIFRGNMGFYVKHQPPFDRDEETGKVKGSWVGIAKDRKSKEILPVEIAKYKEHLEGKDGIAIEPLCEDHHCYFGVVDIDVPDYNYTFLIQKLYQHGLKFSPFVSKSKGLHIYFFWKEKEKGADTIAFLNRVVDTFGLGRLFTSGKGKSKVEVFPKHAVIEPGSQGSCILLPYYNVVGKWHQKMISSEGKLLKFSDAITAIENSFTSVKEMSDVMDALPYSDAPFCVQMIALTGALGEGEGRADYLFSAGVYLKKKYKEGFEGELSTINNALEAPLSEEEVQSTYASVMSKEYQYKCKSGPCAEYCDTKLCKMREYGVGKDKGNQFTGFACWGEISRVMAEEPYYLWSVQVDEGGPFKNIRIDGEADLMNQTIVARSCVRYLNKSPLVVKPNAWVATVNQSLAGIESRIIEIPKETDTTEMSALHTYFVRFLTHKQMKHGLPHLIGLGQVFNRDGFYYFTTEGIKDYLRIQKFTVQKMNLREELIRYGCTEGEVQYSVGDRQKTIRCWKKAEDDDLKTMGTFYEDVEDADRAVLQDGRLNKVDQDSVSTVGAGGEAAYEDCKF